MKKNICLLVIAVTFCALTLGGTAQAQTQPLTGAFHYSWYPQAWNQYGIIPYSNYTPAAGLYSNIDPVTIDRQFADFEHMGLDVVISSWWHRSHHTDLSLGAILARHQPSNNQHSWAIYYECEGNPSTSKFCTGYGPNPPSSQIWKDLFYLNQTLMRDSSYMRIGGKPVVFVYGAIESCDMVNRWAFAFADFHIALKVFPGYQNCAKQPNSWHQYGPDTPYQQHLPHSAAIGAGFWKYGETPRLARDVVRFETDLNRAMASGARWALIATYSEWGEGTQIEPATQFGRAYIDAACRAIRSDCPLPP